MSEKILGVISGVPPKLFGVAKTFLDLTVCIREYSLAWSNEEEESTASPPIIGSK
jgi:hypothetical protein